MLVSHIIEDIELVLSETPSAKDFQIAFVAYHEDGSGNININYVEAFLWDEDGEFFLVPSGAAKYYELTPSTITAGEFLNSLKSIDQKAIKFEAYARSKTKILEDGSVASVNSPLWGTGVHDDANLVYFYYDKQNKRQI